LFALCLGAFLGQSFLALPYLGLVLLADRMIVFIEPQPFGPLIVVVVGHKQVGAITDEQTFGLVGVPVVVQRGDVAVVPVFQFRGRGGLGQFTQVVLVAGGGPRAEVTVVEPGTPQRQVAVVRIDLAAGQLRSQGIDQSAAADKQRITVIASVRRKKGNPLDFPRFFSIFLSKIAPATPTTWQDVGIS
jgi:hypothetical protein